MPFKHNPILFALLVEELLVECAVNTVILIPRSYKNNFIHLAIDWQLIGDMHSIVSVDPYVSQCFP